MSIKGRTYHFTPYRLFSRIGRRRSAAYRSALLHLPAFLLACSPLPDAGQDPVPAIRKAQIYILPSGNTTVRGIDLLFFGQEPLERLDAWQHLAIPAGSRVEGVSSVEARKLAVIGNYPEQGSTWSDIRSFTSLKERVLRLADEDPAAPVLVGTADLPEGSRRTCRVTLRPMLSRITLRSLACDFTGRSYVGEHLQDVRAYLTYAVDVCHPFDPDAVPASWVNAGRLDEDGTEALSHPETVLRDIAPSVGGRIYPSLDYFCYPNPSDGTQFGQPVTRLVIEGKLRGTTYYYPIDLPGLKADVQYRLDVTLTRAGTTDPDIHAAAGTILLEGSVLDWDSRVWNDIHFS